MNKNKIILIVILAVALAFAQTAAASAGANATLSDPAKFHLWLKCRAVELYINATGVGLRGNVTLPRCEELLQNFTSNRLVFVIGRAGVRPLPMIGVGELKALNASDPKAVFAQLREIRRQALLNLSKHVNKTVDVAYREMETGNGTEPLERAIFTLTRVRSLLEKVNASRRAVDILQRNIELLNDTRQFIAEAGTAPLDKLTVLLEKIQNRIADLPPSKRQIIEKQILKTRGVIEERGAKELALIYMELYMAPDAEALTVLNKSITNLQRALALLEKVNASQNAVEALKRHIAILNESRLLIEAWIRGDLEKAKEHQNRLEQILSGAPDFVKKVIESKIGGITKAVRERGAGASTPWPSNVSPPKGSGGRGPNK